MDFEEYIRQGEPDKKEKASIWQTANLANKTNKRYGTKRMERD